MIIQETLKNTLRLILLIITISIANRSLFGQEQLITLAPDLTTSASSHDYQRIPFKVMNASGEDLMIDPDIMLMTKDDYSNKLSIELFCEGGEFGSQERPSVLLHPGQTTTIYSNFSANELAFVKSKGKAIFGEINGCSTATKKKFQSDSKPFSVPEALTKLPWIDIGIKNYFSVVPFLDRITSSFSGTRISIPLKVRNTSTIPLVLNNQRAIFYFKDTKSEIKASLLFDTLRSSQRIVNPGETLEISSQSRVLADYLNSVGFKSGDKVVGMIAGKVPNTNQVFECLSDPFIPKIRGKE
jgi:hypothetical protein